MEEIGYDDCFFGGGVCLIEWAEQIAGLLPENTVFVTIEKDLSRGDDYRRITLRYPAGTAEEKSQEILS